MKTLTLLILLCSLMALMACAVVPMDPTRTLKYLDIASRDIALDDGQTYYVMRGIDLGKFAVGDRVTVHVEDRNGRQMVTKLFKGRTPRRPCQTVPPVAAGFCNDG